MSTGKVDALLGIVFGDEGKGKVVDVFTPRYDIVARFAGGPNAGHTIIFEGKKFVLRSIPSGIFDQGKLNIIGNGCVIAPDLFMAEARELESAGYQIKELGGSFHENGYSIPQMQIRRKEKKNGF